MNSLWPGNNISVLMPTAQLSMGPLTATTAGQVLPLAGIRADPSREEDAATVV